MSNPTIVNSNPAANGGGSTPTDHSRKASVTIGANGVSGYPPNGAPVAPNSKPNIVFGQQNPGNSPAQSNAAAVNQASSSASSLGAPSHDLHVTEPTSSPSPIPPRPTPSGGPPSGYHSQSSSVNFGSMENNNNPPMRGGPQGGQFAPQHLRRESSQSGPGDMGVPMAQTPSRGSYMGGRGGRGYHQQQQQSFHNQMPYSPGQGLRPMANQQRPGNVPPHFQGQGVPQHPNSPHHQPRSPGYGSSNPTTPQMHHMQMANNQGMGYGQPYNAYAQQLNTPQQGYNTMQQSYDPNYGYYAAQYQMPPQHMQQYSRSPQPYPQVPPTARQQYMQNQYNQPQAPSMSRTPSQMSASDRPPSSVGGSQAPPPSMTPQPSQPSHTPNQPSASSINFTIPSRAKKALVIKDNDGNIVNFDKKPSPAPSAPSAPSPAASTPAPTPPPQAAAATAAVVPSHNRTESKTSKTKEQIRAEFLEKVKKEQEAEKGGVEEKAEDEKAVAVEEPLPEPVAEKAAEKSETPAPVAATETPVEPVAPAEAPAETKPTEAKSAEDDEAEKKRKEDEEFERMVAEMEAAEREEEEREKAFKEKKAKQDEEKKKREKEEAAKADEEMKRLEREAEAAEEERENKKAEERDESDEAKSIFASLKKPAVGPGAESQSGTATPTSEDSSVQLQAPTTQPPPRKSSPSEKPKPGPLKLETKPAEPAQPTAGMKALRTARVLKIEDQVQYPEGVSAPTATGEKRAAYDKAFLTQFMERYKEKPTIDWDSKLKETIGDPTDSAAPKSGRTPSTAMGGRAPSGRGPPAQAFNPMGSFGAGPNRPLRPGTTSQERFEAANRAAMQNPLGPFVQSRNAPFPMGGMGVQMARSGSAQNLAHGQSPRSGPSQRGRGESGRGQRVPSRKETEQMNKSMPLTAGLDLKPLHPSSSGWKPTSIGRPAAAAAAPTDGSGLLAPEMVQRKVKSNLNKMTPERFDKISEQILVIAQQSKDETDGRTLRQVIALTFEKACDEMHWASMYAKFCQRMLEGIGPEVKDDNVKDKNGNATVGGQLFRKYLLNRCQEEFEHGWSVASNEKKEGEEETETKMMSEEYYKEAAIKRKGLGLVKFIGELYKLGMLSTRIMHQCVHKLLDFEGMPEESSIESLTQFLTTVGGMMEASDAKNAEMMKAYFERIEKIQNMPDLPSRMRFMLMDLVDLRTQGWRSKNATKGPKTIQEIHQEEAARQMQAAAEAERQRQSQRGGGGRPQAGRGDARQFSGNAPPVDYARNQVASDDLRKLSSMRSTRTASSGPGKSLGPSSMFASRSSSGRGNLGPSLLGGGGSGGGDQSSGSSRAPSHKAEKKEEDAGSKNAFEALASLDNEGDGTPASSPPVTKARPAIASEVKADDQSAQGDA